MYSVYILARDRLSERIINYVVPTYVHSIHCFYKPLIKIETKKENYLGFGEPGTQKCS
jgi:hypothetical protein